MTKLALVDIKLHTGLIFRHITSSSATVTSAALHYMEGETSAWGRRVYTVSQKTVKIVFVRTSSNFHQL